MRSRFNRLVPLVLLLLLQIVSSVYLIRRAGECSEAGVAEADEERTTVFRSATGLNAGGGANFKVGGVLNLDSLPLGGAPGASTSLGGIFVMEDGDDESAPSIIYVNADVSKPLDCLPSRHFHWIHTEHLIEHLNLEDGIAFLSTMRRLLMPGGTLRVTTPDLRKYAAALAARPEDDDADAEESTAASKDADLFANLYNEYTCNSTCESERWGWTGKLVPSRPADMVNGLFYDYGHRHLYDYSELRHAAFSAGWTRENDCRIRRGSFRSGLNPVLAGFDGDHHELDTLYVDLSCSR